jgi:hypothetical protein
MALVNESHILYGTRRLVDAGRIVIADSSLNEPEMSLLKGQWSCSNIEKEDFRKVEPNIITRQLGTIAKVISVLSALPLGQI